MKVLLINPPLTQVNTPYPAIGQLTAFLSKQGIPTVQADLSIELIDRVFQSDTLHELFDQIEAMPRLSRAHRRLVAQRAFFERTLPSILSFLRGADTTLVTRFARPEFWQDVIEPVPNEQLEWAYGASGLMDQAKYLATRCLKSVAQLLQQTTHPFFELIRYAEQIALCVTDFATLEQPLHDEPSYIDQLMLQLLQKHLEQEQPDWVGFSVPFPGNLYGALRCADYLRSHYPHIKIVMGGGYVNTELRQLSDVRLFNYIDYLTFDDGELPLLRLFTGGELIRTAYAENGQVVWANRHSCQDTPFSEWEAPTWRGLQQSLYFDLVETANPMHRLWSVGRWNKLMLAHGCYWAKCSFCDTTLDYIGRFEQAPIERIVDRMEAMMKESGISGFHFTDEAAPPALLRKLADEILKRKLVVSYWTNVRFDKSFTPELAYLMAQSGCIAVSGGLEVASDRLLKLINKGVTLESARQSMMNLSNNGIMVHTYLMYGFPTETVAELYESLRHVRDLFAEGLIQSAFWHRYAMTCHSSSGQNPHSVGAKAIDTPIASFANNEIPFETSPCIDWSLYQDGLTLATYNYMQGTGFDFPIKQWFKHK